MKNFKNISLVMGLMILSACGSKSSHDLPLTATDNNTSGTTTTNTTSSAGNVYNLPAAREELVQLSGNNGGAFSKTLNLNTSKKLRVRVEALSAPNLTVPGYTNWVFPYGCMRVTVTVNGATRTSKLLKVADVAASSQCANAPSVDTLDFSNITTGNGPVSVTFSNAEYDNCRYYGNVFQYGCDVKAVWQNHQVRFNATVEVDGTYME